MNHIKHLSPEESLVALQLLTTGLKLSIRHQSLLDNSLITLNRTINRLNTTKRNIDSLNAYLSIVDRDINKPI